MRQCSLTSKLHALVQSFVYNVTALCSYGCLIDACLSWMESNTLQYKVCHCSIDFEYVLSI